MSGSRPRRAAAATRTPRGFFSRGWDYAGSDEFPVDWEMLCEHPDQLEEGFGDVLAYEGYLPKYPKNPFQQGSEAGPFGIDAYSSDFSQWAGYGGREGKLMINIGWWGEAPQLMLSGSTAYAKASIVQTMQNHVPGNFYYHPRWADGATNRAHLEHQAALYPGVTLPCRPVRPPLDDSADVLEHVVAGYDLFATGSPRTKGQDYDNSCLLGRDHIWRTGYATLGQERNPWVRAGDYAVDNDSTTADYDERPYSDGVHDFFVIHLGAGMDKKTGKPGYQKSTDQSTTPADT